jgi:hypothetical protein
VAQSPTRSVESSIVRSAWLGEKSAGRVKMALSGERMVSGERTARREQKASGERGYVTAETALLLPILLAVGYALMLVVVLVGDQIRCADAAWEAARELARGVSAAELPSLVARYAPEGSHASAWSADGALTVEVDRDQSIASRLLPVMRISAAATVPCEPRVEGCASPSPSP